MNEALSPLVFVGFDSLRQFTREINPLQPVFAARYTDLGQPDSRGLRTDKEFALIAQPLNTAAVVYYCRFLLAEHHSLNLQPFDADHAQRVDAADDAWQRILDSLFGLMVVNGLVALPQNIHLRESVPVFP
jgi:hypothetical protein